MLADSLTELTEAQWAVAGVAAIYYLGAAFQAGGPFTVEDCFEIDLSKARSLLGCEPMYDIGRMVNDSLQHISKERWL